MQIDRRRALGLLGLGAAIAPTPAPAATQAPAFRHGVASGDPLQDRVVIWTRVTAPGAPTVRVKWTVATDADLRSVVKRGVFTASGERDYTVKVDVDGLTPGKDYFYAFESGGTRSPVGRTRTLAAAGATEPVVLAVASCSLFPNGLFNAYDAISRLDEVDAVVHLGDYIYEYGADPKAYGMQNGLKLGRIPEPPHEIVTREDYRLRHAQYKADPDLQAAHARAPWICVFDDHEVTNDPWRGGAENHNPEAGEGTWTDRKAAALRAYYEWMPIREPGPGRTREMIYRSFRFGAVASLHMLETRLLARSEQLDYEKDLTTPGPDGKPRVDVPAFTARLNDPGRELMGPGQLEWLTGELKASVAAGVAWQVIGNQVVMAKVAGPDIVKALGQERLDKAMADLSEGRRKRLQQQAQLFALGLPMNLDAWDGYPAERERLYGAFAHAKAHPVVITGDVHSFWANELNDAGGRRAAVEFVTSGITSPSPGFGSLLPGVPLPELVADQNADVLFTDWKSQGFVKLTLTRDAVRGEFTAVSTILAKPYETKVVATYEAKADAAGVGPLTGSPAA